MLTDIRINQFAAQKGKRRLVVKLDVVKRIGENFGRPYQTGLDIFDQEQLHGPRLPFLAAVEELRSGTHWVSLGGKDPLYYYLKTVHQMFEELGKMVDAEILKRVEEARTSGLEAPTSGPGAWACHPEATTCRPGAWAFRAGGWTYRGPARPEAPAAAG